MHPTSEVTKLPSLSERTEGPRVVPLFLFQLQFLLIRKMQPKFECTLSKFRRQNGHSRHLPADRLSSRGILA